MGGQAELSSLPIRTTSSAMSVELDVLTKRPRTPNDPYTCLTQQQIENIKAEQSPHFHVVPIHSNQTATANIKDRPNGRLYNDRYCQVTSKHLVREHDGSHSFGYIAEQFQRIPPESYNACRGRAAARWGPNKAGERTLSHFVKEGVDRYTNIDMYRRNPTNYAGSVMMDYGRPAQGYFAQKYPSSNTWFESSAPLNKATNMETVRRKSFDEYKILQQNEQNKIRQRQGQWPEFSEYTGKYLLKTKTSSTLNHLQDKKHRLHI